MRYRDEVGLRGTGSLCEETLCDEGVDYPIGTDEGRHATKYYGDGATMGYVPSTDPLSPEYDPNPYASLSPQLPPQPQAPPQPSAPSLVKSPSPPEPPLPPPAFPPGLVPVPFPPGRAPSPTSPSPPPPPTPPPPSPPPPSPPPSPPPPSPPPPSPPPPSPPPPSPPPPSPPPPSPPPSPPPPSPPPPAEVVQLRANESLIDTIANAAVGVPLDVRLSAGTHTLPAEIDGTAGPSEIWITAAEPGAVLSSDLTLQDGAPTTHIRGFTITGAIEIVASQRPVEIAECDFVGGVEYGGFDPRADGLLRAACLASDSNRPPVGRRLGDVDAERPALLLSASTARVNVRNSTFTRLAVGIEVLGGQLNLSNSELSRSTLGLKVSGGQVFITGTTVHHCSGAALDVKGTADVTLSGETVLLPPTDAYAIILDSTEGAEVRYQLPAPLGYYVLADGEGVAQITECIEGEYPYPCSAGLVGDSFDKQSTPRCNGFCPAGHYCESATTEPKPCSAGTYCPPGSPAEVDCPAGTSGDRTELTRLASCIACPAGTECPKRSLAPEPCALGTHAPSPQSAKCDPCPAGSYQSNLSSVQCVTCIPGHVCPEGSAEPQPCLAGTYNGIEGLEERSQCLDCPLGFYCSEGASSPLPCEAGRRGASSRLGDRLACIPCPEGTTSITGSSTCDMCTRGNYELPRQAGNAALVCEPCVEHASCATDDLTVRTLVVDAAHWRLGPLSQDIYACATGEDGWSPCRGGVDASDVLQGVDDGPVQRLYCEEGYEGPLCELCSNSSTYFDESEKRCLVCPDASKRVFAIIGIGILVFVGLIATLGFLLRPARGAHLHVQRTVGLLLRQLYSRSQALALIPKLKLFISFFQCAMALPTVYNVSLPDSYFEWTAFMDWLSIDWSGFAIPGSCLPGGYYSRLLLGGVGPLVLLALVFLVSFPIIIVIQLRDARKNKSRIRSVAATVGNAIVQATIQTLPIVLFVSFCLCAPTSSSIFATWSCAEYTEDSLASTGRSYLRADKRMQCTTYTESGTELTAEYERVIAAAIPLVVVWAVLMPLLFFAAVQPSRTAIRRSRSTPLVRATAFLHREYEPQYYFWEAVYLAQRLILVGFVQFIPREQEHLRLLVGMLVALSYLILLLTTKPYRRNDLDSLAVMLQISLALLLLFAMNVQIFNSLEQWYGAIATQRVLGFDSLNGLVSVMVVLNLLVLATFLFMMLYQMFSQQSVGIFRLVHSNQPPDLVLGGDMRYHLFLSHIWSTGQDQCAVIKRQLNLLLPGISVFLDVDDLEDIGALETYIEQTQCMLLFQSRGYYLSRNCLREVDATFEQQKAHFLVHEADKGKGGGPLSMMKQECASKRFELAEVLFNEEQLVVPWHRVADFQLLSLRLIAERTCATTLGASPRDSELDQGSRLYARGEIQRMTFVFRDKVSLYTSAANPGAAAAALELADKFGGAAGGGGFTTTQRRPAAFTDYVASEEEKLIDQNMTEPAITHALKRSGSSKFFSTRRPAPAADVEATHMVLYLNEQTFVSEAGEILAHELREARAAGLPIEMLHECDPARGGCEFATFFNTTPEDLLVDGLFTKLATALHPGPHREVSFAQLAKSLGAVGKGGSVADARKHFAVADRQSRLSSRLSSNEGSAVPEGSKRKSLSFLSKKKSVPTAAVDVKQDVTSSTVV